MLIAATESVVVAMFTWMSVVEALPSFGGSYETAIEPVFGAANAPCASTRLARTVAAAMTLFMFVSSFRPETVGGNLRSRAAGKRNYGTLTGRPRTFQYLCRYFTR